MAEMNSKRQVAWFSVGWLMWAPVAAVQLRLVEILTHTQLAAAIKTDSRLGFRPPIGDFYERWMRQPNRSNQQRSFDAGLRRMYKDIVTAATRILGSIRRVSRIEFDANCAIRSPFNPTVSAVDRIEAQFELGRNLDICGDEQRCPAAREVFD